MKIGRVISAADEEDEKKLANFSLKDLKFSRSLGSGKFGTVYLATHKSGIKLAVKKIPKDSLKNRAVREHLHRWIDNHRMMRHQYITRFYAKLEDNDSIYLIMQYVGDHSLHKLLEE